MTDTTNQEKLIDLFARNVETIVNPVEILPHLRKEGLINQLDMEEIETASTSRSRTASCTKMLDCIPRRKGGWYETFLGVLACNNYGHLVRDIDDVFYESTSLRLICPKRA